MTLDVQNAKEQGTCTTQQALFFLYPKYHNTSQKENVISFPVKPFLSQEETTNLQISKLEGLEQNRATFYLCMYSIFNISVKCCEQGLFFLSKNEQIVQLWKSSTVIYLDQYFYPALQMQTDQLEWFSPSIAGNSLTTATKHGDKAIIIQGKLNLNGKP